MCKVVWPKIWGNFQWSQKEVVMFLNSSISLVCIPPFSLLSVSKRKMLLMKFQQENHNHKKYLLWHCSMAHTDLCLSYNLYVSGNITAKAKLAWLVRPRLPYFWKVKMLMSGKNAQAMPFLKTSKITQPIVTCIYPVDIHYKLWLVFIRIEWKEI